eukprot:CAMPEP_0114366962 /NCGR_PEP_ID=MMETSP0101-20121206/29707_1 /TAXON_ID=38822 ORGANISM="Pteridomonas danica, Strain PT" /NCGR_SAMPLE_ID=MMETSP0101 /ASSEMBLY_ACC=CAM_ASM_000211 /LENGTH=393 /DNA_ID=CAMNT_0001516361 /DNA_START=439 /DNA_END=1617 /DNA_ORIENTATION=+
MKELELKAIRVGTGLEKLEKGAEDVEEMKIGLAQEDLKLRSADEATTRMLGQLQKSSMNAKKESEAVGKIRELCQVDANRIAAEKKVAEDDLAQAQPFVEEAERAVNSVKPNDLNELKKLQKPSDFYFNKYEKDLMNDETMEFLAPYLDLEGFTPIIARNASKAAEGLCVWVKAMNMYHEAAKMVKPKLEALRLAEAQLADAQLDLDKAQSKLDICQDVLDKLKEDFDEQMASKKSIAEGADKTRIKMNQATSLINGLAGERERWTEDSIKFEERKSNLVGDVAIASSFLVYLGPFNEIFRNDLLHNVFITDLKERSIPMTSNFDLSSFLVSDDQIDDNGGGGGGSSGMISEWTALEGLPNDPFSIQNGILTTSKQSLHYPLFIDPQGQALNW